MTWLFIWRLETDFCVLQQLEEELCRRHGLHLAAVERRQLIAVRYAPHHRHVYHLQVSHSFSC